MIELSAMDRDVVEAYRSYSVACRVSGRGEDEVLVAQEQMLTTIAQVVRKHIGSRVRTLASLETVLACYHCLVGMLGLSMDPVPIFRKLSTEVVTELDGLALSGWMGRFVHAEKRYRQGALSGDWIVTRTQDDEVGFHLKVQFILNPKIPRWERLP